MTEASGASAGRVFISYRRGDAGYPAGWLFDRLVDRFGAGRVFKDVDSIEPGDDFAEVITATMKSCAVLLAVIGPHWLRAAGQDGRRRLDDPADFVRLEIEAALARGVRVIPVLVDGAQVPRPEQLPASLGRLAGRQALELSHARFGSDIGRLMSVLDRMLSGTPAASEARQPPPDRAAPDRTRPPAGRAPMTLQDALVLVLRENNREPMTARQLADAVNERGLYHMRDGRPVEVSQIHARTNVYGALFKKAGGLIRLWENPAAGAPLPPAITRFQDDDTGFLNWRDGHPGGFIVNSERNPGPSYLVLHRATCPHLVSPNQLHWTKDYIKFCSSGRTDLEDWAKATVGGEVTLCRTCFGR